MKETKRSKAFQKRWKRLNKSIMDSLLRTFTLPQRPGEGVRILSKKQKKQNDRTSLKEKH